MVNQSFYNLGVEPSVIRKLFAYGLEQAKKIGAENVYDYSLGNPSIPSPQKVNDSIVDILNKTDSIKVHGYSVASGFDFVRESIADNLRKRFDNNISATDLFLTCGAAPGLISVFKALNINADTEFIAVAPFFPEYIPFVHANNSKLVIVSPDTVEFQIKLSEVETKINEHTQGIIINSPNNPSGVVYSEDTLKSLASLLENKSKEYGHPIYIIADEPYRELVYGNVVVPWIPHIYRNTIVCYSYSKSLSLPGERIGYVYVPSFADESKDLYYAITGAARILGHVCPPTLIQQTVARCADCMPNLDAYNENRILLFDELSKIGYEMAKPDGAFYLFVKVPNGDAVAFSEKARLDYNLLVVPGDGFYCPGYVRLCYCVSNDMIKRSLPAFKALMDYYKK